MGVEITAPVHDRFDEILTDDAFENYRLETEYRFAGKPVVSSGVKRPIDDADAMVAEALRYAADPERAPRVEGSADHGTTESVEESWGGRVRRVLMTGVSYMIPFVAAGGLLIALGFLLGGYEIVGPYGDIAVTHTIFDLPDPDEYGLEHALFGSGLMAYLGALFFIIGKTAFMLFIPAFAGYIAYAIADRPGLTLGLDALLDLALAQIEEEQS